MYRGLENHRYGGGIHGTQRKRGVGEIQGRSGGYYRDGCGDAADGWIGADPGDTKKQ